MTNYARWQYRPQSLDRSNLLARAQTFGELNNFPFPDVSTTYHVDGLATQVQHMHARGLAVGGKLPHLGGELFDAAWNNSSWTCWNARIGHTSYLIG